MSKLNLQFKWHRNQKKSHSSKTSPNEIWIFLFLSDEPPQLESHFDQVKERGVDSCHFYIDHCYTHKGSDANDVEEKESMIPLHLTNALYRNYVVLNLEQRKDLEAAIRLQKSSSMQENYELLFQLTTSEAFIYRKLYKLTLQQFLMENNMKMIPFLQYQCSQGVNVLVSRCGVWLGSG